MKAKALIAGVLITAGFVLALLSFNQEDVTGHIPLPLGIPALACTLTAGVLTVQLWWAEGRRWKALNGSLQAANATLTRIRQQPPRPPVSIETGHTIIDLVPIDVREIAS